MMKLSSIADTLWGNKSRVSYLLIATVVLLFTMLGAREIWTQEHRWADIVSGMFFRNDFLHPFLGDSRYYDKPLLSYWLIALIAKISGELSMWSLRLPSALAGVLSVWSIYLLGTKLKDRQLGLLSGWLLLTTFYFVFWARTSSADMLNLGGSLFAVAWYMQKRDQATFIDYGFFFLIVALTSLCKGLVGAIVPLLAVFTDMVLQKSIRRHLRWPLFLALIPALIIYLLPFWASSHFGGEAYGQSGLYLVYKENIMRYFQPFDHQGPIYTYFLYLPIYMLPWAFFFIPALIALRSQWKTLTLNSKWIAYTVLVLFLFFTLSGSRRSYYVLPIVPFALLVTANWILSSRADASRRCWATATVVFSYLVLFLTLDVLSPLYYAKYGVNRFAWVLKKDAETIKPWNKWNVVMLDAESKLVFYLGLPPNIKNYDVENARDEQTTETLLHSWPILKNKPANTIFVTRKMYAVLLQPYFKGYRMVEAPKENDAFFLGDREVNTPVAFVPEQ